MYDDDKRTVWLHVHVPKCGGSTLRYVLSRNFGEGYYSGHTLMDQLIYTKDQVEVILNRNPWLRCYSDHKLSLDLPYESDAYKLKAFAFIRNPVDKIISHYFWGKNIVKANNPAKEMNLDEYITYLKEKNHETGPIKQIRHLNPYKAEKPSLDFIKNITEQHEVYLLPVDQYDLACVLLETIAPDTFKNMAYVKENVSPRNETVTGEQFERIHELVQTDLELKEYTDKTFNANLSRFLPSGRHDALLADFKERCEKLSHAEQPPEETIQTDASGIEQPAPASLKQRMGRNLINFIEKRIQP